MFDFIFLFVYAFVLTTALRKTTGDGMYAFPAILFSFAAALGSAVIMGLCSFTGIIGMLVGALIACSLLALAIHKILSVELRNAWIVAAICAGFQLTFSFTMMWLSTPA